YNPPPFPLTSFLFFLFYFLSHSSSSPILTQPFSAPFPFFPFFRSSVLSIHLMWKDEWVSAAMTDDTVVVELLVRLKQSQATAPARMMMTTVQSSCGAVIPLRWGLRLPRSKSAAAAASASGGSMRCDVVSRRKEGDSSTRCSPTTPLSWSGGGGAESPSAAADGYEETSHRSPSGSRSKGGTGTAAEITSTGTTNTKRTRRKKTLAELREEECFLWKERMHLKKEIQTLHATVEDERTMNQRLKRIKCSMNSNNSNNNLAASPGERAELEQQQQQQPPLSTLAVPHSNESCSRTDDTCCSGSDPFLLPDLNMMPSEDDPATTL
ncbi:hypothetical protein LINPERPRIM_LOCUS19750, partial [Linum perenne]